MQDNPLPLIRDLVLIGGGHSHALVLRMWGMNALPGIRLTLINPGPAAPYTGMLPGYVAGHYRRIEMMIDLPRLCHFSGARLILARAVGLDLTDRRIGLDDGTWLDYDLASLDVGIGSAPPHLPGFADHTIAAKPLGPFAQRWGQFVSQALPDPKVVVIGAGVGGVELALAAHFRLHQLGRQPQITVVTRGQTALAGLAARSRREILAELQVRGIALITGQAPTTASARSVTLTDGRILASDFTLSAIGAQPQDWLGETGLALTGGFVAVDATLRTSDPSVFAAGDCAHLIHAPRPKSGVYAVRAAPVLFVNLRASFTGRAPRRFNPQRNAMKLIALGGKSALADTFGLTFSGPRLWDWKDRIDRRFMAKFTDFPAMPAPTLPAITPLGLTEAIGAKPLCGGCGAKVGAGALSAITRVLPAIRRDDVLSGPGDDAAMLRVGGQIQVITTDHLRAVTRDPRLMARIAAIHALGDIWAMGAAPQAALSQIILPRMSAELQARTLAEITAAAAAVFAAAGAEIVGGHTSTGTDLTIGFTVTGLVTHPITKSGAAVGDVLILTKPLGVATVLAAEMAAAHLPDALLGDIVVATHASMCQPLGTASALLARHATAMTDVTGFGLAGHLLEILTASDMAATIRLSAIPYLPGAVALASAGHASTLAPANRAALLGRIDAPVDPRSDLLFDPQTCGGLLAAVPADRADTVIAALRNAGVPAARIGTTTAGKPFLTVTD